MKKHIYLIITIISILLSGCINKQRNIEGYWTGKYHYNDYNDELVVKFDNGICVFSRHMPDSFTYKINDKEIIISPVVWPNEKYNLKYQLKRDSLFLYTSGFDTLIYSLKKLDEKCYIDKKIKDSNIEIDLPSSYSHKIRVFDIADNNQYFLYLGYDKDKLLVGFKNQVYFLDSNFYKIFTDSFDYEFDYYKHSLNLFIDKNIKYSDFEILANNLLFSSLTRVRFILKSNNPDSINVLERRLKPLSELEYNKLQELNKRNSNQHLLPPPPPSLLDLGLTKLKKSPIVEIFKNSILLNGEELNIKSLNELQLKIQNKELEPLILIYTDNSASYDYYIKTLLELYHLIDKLRNEYSLLIFQMNYNALTEDNQIKIQELFPYRFGEVNKQELELIKNGL